MALNKVLPRYYWELWAVCMQVLLCRTHLRRGAQRFWVKSLLYIPPERSSGPKKPLGQVNAALSVLCRTPYMEILRSRVDADLSIVA